MAHTVGLGGTQTGENSALISPDLEQFTISAENLNEELFTSDNVHLSAAGYEIYAQRLSPLISKLLTLNR